MTSGSIWLEATVSSSCNKYVPYATVATGTGYKFMRETNYVLEKHAL